MSASSTPGSVADLVAAHRVIALDSDVLIYLLENRLPGADRVAEIVDALEAGAVRSVIATVAITEVLTGPARTGDTVAFETMADELQSIQHLRIVPLDAELASDAAWLRGAGDRDLVDAVHLASARKAGATVFVTNDRRIRSRPGLEVIYLSDLVTA